MTCLFIIQEGSFGINMKPGFLPIYKRDMRRFFRFKHQLLSSFLQPVLWLAFFGMAMAGNFDRIMGSNGSIHGVMEVSYLTFMCAGIIGATILFTNIFGGFFLLFDKNWGILREIMASPLPRRNIIIGIGCAAITKSWIQSVTILVFGMILGVTFFVGMSPLRIIISVIGFLLFVAAFATAFLCISLTIALRIDSPEGFQGISSLLTMPLFFLSNSLYPLEGLPPLMGTIALLNPLTHLITGIRYCTIGEHFSSIGMEVMYNSTEVLFSFLYLAIFALVMFTITLKTVEKVEIT